MLYPHFVLSIKSWVALARDRGVLDPRWDILMIALISMLVAGVFLVSLVRRCSRNEIDPASLFSLAPMGGILILILLSFPIFLWGTWRGEALNFKAIFLTLTVGLGIGALLLNLHRPKPSAHSTPTLLALAFLLCGLGLLRLTFIQDLVMPPYSDSVEHYLIVNDLLYPESQPQAFYNLARITSRYYHFGFHALAGWVGALSASPVQETLLVLGQILQAVIPVSLFFLVRAITRSDAAGLLSVLLAGLAWRMPGFASNWGKYPALMSLAVFPFALGMLSLADSAAERREKLTLTAIALAGGFLSILSHTRISVLLAVALGSWWIAGGVLKAPAGWKISAVLASASLTLWLAYQISGDSGLIFMLAPYVREGFLPTLLVALLVPCGLKNYPRQMVSALLFLLFLLAGALIPLPAALERFGYQSLLDRPFTQMVLFLPLSVIAGIGLAGLMAGLDGSRAAGRHRDLLRGLRFSAALLLPLAVTLNAFRLYGFSPSSCCQLATVDDMAAYQWIRENLPADAVILIASNRTPSRSFGVDGGIWITALTGYRTEKWPHNAPMDSPVVLEQICAKGATHIYAGGTSARFSVERMENKPGWYENLFTRPGAYVYEIIGCSSAGD